MKLSLPEDKFPYIFSLFYFIFNSFFVSRVLALTHDSIYYYDEIISRPDNLFPHHLIFTPFMSRSSEIIKYFGVGSDLIAMSLVNTIAGSVIIIIIYKILTENFSYTKLASRIAVLICSFSFSFWFYNLNIETYQLPLVFVFSSIFFLTREPRKNSELYFAAILGGIGVLFHQLHGLFGLVAVIFLTISGFKKNLNQIIIFTILFNIVWISGYSIAIYLLDLRTFEEVSRWFFLYHHDMDGWTSFNTSFFIAPLIGFLRSFVSINGIFINSNLSERIFNSFRNQNLEDDAYIVRNLNSFDFFIYLVLLLILISLVGYLLISNFSAIKQAFAKTNNRSIILILSIVYSGFFIFWAPVNLEFWIPQSLAFWIMLSALFTQGFIDRKKVFIAFGIIFILFYVNFRYTILLTKDLENDMYYAEVKDALTYLPNNAIIVYDYDWIIGKYYELYAPNLKFVSFNVVMDSSEAEAFREFIFNIIEKDEPILIKSDLMEIVLLPDPDILSRAIHKKIGLTNFISFNMTEN